MVGNGRGGEVAERERTWSGRLCGRPGHGREWWKTASRNWGVRRDLGGRLAHLSWVGPFPRHDGIRNLLSRLSGVRLAIRSSSAACSSAIAGDFRPPDVGTSAKSPAALRPPVAGMLLLDKDSLRDSRNSRFGHSDGRLYGRPCPVGDSFAPFVWPRGRDLPRPSSTVSKVLAIAIGVRMGVAPPLRLSPAAPPSPVRRSSCFLCQLIPPLASETIPAAPGRRPTGDRPIPPDPSG